MNVSYREALIVADELRELLTEASVHLAQYRRYAEEMRAIGRGMVPSAKLTPDLLERCITSVLQAAPVQTTEAELFQTQDLAAAQYRIERRERQA